MNEDALPRMVEVRQDFAASQSLDLPALLQQQFEATGVSRHIVPGMRIAVGVGSRGISNLKELVRATLDILLRLGARPFIVPAMGSHGGATPEGQANVLGEYGITTGSMGVPFETGMEVRSLGTTSDGFDVVFSMPALQADGVIAINRIKPHTDFGGALGSGIQKMLTIGFGKHAGAANAHRAAIRVGHEKVIRDFAQVILGSVPVLCGVALVEDQHHETAEICVMQPETIVSQEDRLLEKARLLMPRLPMDEIDLLIVDRIGKELSGTGMDTNVIGRGIFGYMAALNSDDSRSPRIFRIFVRELSEHTNGNGIGIGLADFTTSRLVRGLDLHSTYINALTSLGLPTVKIPIHFETDRETIQQAVASLASTHPERLRIVRISDTLNLERMLVSEPCLGALRGDAEVTVVGAAEPMTFDAAGNMLPF
jgi:Lactate racemase N-terminal domain